MKINLSDSIIKSIFFEKVEFIFGYPGGAVLNIYDSIFSLNLKHILVRHEQAAVHMADGYSRSSKKIGLVLVTSGPGFTNCITGLATANIDNSGILLLSGQVNKKLIAQNSFQELNNSAISLSIINQFYFLNCQYNIPYLISKSFNVLKNVKEPIIIDFPKDLTDNNKKIRYNYPVIRNKNKKKKIINLYNCIINSKRPVIIFGGGTVKTKLFKNFLNYINLIKIPYLFTIMGIGAVDYRSPYYFGWVGMHGDAIANIIVNFSDLLICVGTRLDDRITNKNNLFSPYSKIIHIDINENSINKTIKCNDFFVSPAKDIINLFFKIKLKKNWLKLIIFFNNFFKNKYKNNFTFCNPQQIIEYIYIISKGKFIISTDVGQHQMFTAKYFFFNYKKLLTSGGLGTMGFGFPAAIGIKFSNKNCKILLITGEGSFQMMMQELSTCKQYKINIFIINLNNQSLGMVKQWQELNYACRYSNSYVYALPNFNKLINSYNFLSFNIYKINYFYCFFLSIIKKNIFCFINIFIDNKENVFPIQIFNKSMDEFITFYSNKKYEKKINFLFQKQKRDKQFL